MDVEHAALFPRFPEVLFGVMIFAVGWGFGRWATRKANDEEALRHFNLGRICGLQKASQILTDRFPRLHESSNGHPDS